MILLKVYKPTFIIKTSVSIFCRQLELKQQLLPSQIIRTKSTTTIENSNNKKMNFVKIPSERFDEVIKHLRSFFFYDEPLNKSVQLCKPGCGHEELEKLSLSSLEDGLSVMAVTNDNKIAGVALNGVIYPNEIADALELLEQKDDEQFKKIFNLLYTTNLKLDLFNRYNVDRIFDIRILSVDSEFRGQGLAKELAKQCERVAIENGFTMMKTDATGLFSQKAVQSLGFETIQEIPYDSCFNEDGTIRFNVDPPHKCLKIMQKQLPAKK